MSKVFIDTNILVYSMDSRDKKKKTKCRSLLKTLDNKKTGVISTQVIQEFYVTAVKKLKIEPLPAKSIIHTFQNLETVIINPEIINEAIDCSIIHQLSFWDSLIITAAETAKCEQIWTEDLNDNQIIRGVRIVNPLK